MRPVVIGGIPMVRVSGGIFASRTPVTVKQYAGPIQPLLGNADGPRYVELTRGLHGHVAVRPMSESGARGECGADKIKSADSGGVVRLRSDDSRFLYKLVARPSPAGFDGDNQPVVNVAPVEAQGWCELAGGLLCLPSTEFIRHILTRGGKSKYPCGDSLFDRGENRLVHAQLKLREGKILRAEEGDPEHNSATCDVEATHPTGKLKGRLIYPDGFKGTRWGGNVCFWAVGDVLCGASWNNNHPANFEGSNFNQNNPDNRNNNIGFGVVSAQHSLWGVIIFRPESRFSRKSGACLRESRSASLHGPSLLMEDGAKSAVPRPSLVIAPWQ